MGPDDVACGLARRVNQPRTCDCFLLVTRQGVGDRPKAVIDAGMASGREDARPQRLVLSYRQAVNRQSL
jgi:hypothetical protein